MSPTRSMAKARCSIQNMESIRSPARAAVRPGRFVDAEREVVLPQVERGLAGAGCKQHGEAPVFPAVDFQFLFIIFQDMRVLAAHVMQDAPEQRQAVLHFLVPEIREFPKPLHVPGNVLRQRLVGKHLEIAPENRHQCPEALISGLLRQGIGDGRQLDRHLHLVVEEQALALHDEDQLRVLRAFLEGRVGVGFSPVPQVSDDEFEAEQGSGACWFSSSSRYRTTSSHSSSGASGRRKPR